MKKVGLDFMNNFQTVTISVNRYEELIKTERLLECLYATGLDNWDGYDYAIDMFEDESKSENED